MENILTKQMTSPLKKPKASLRSPGLKLKPALLPNQNQLMQGAGKLFSIMTELRQRNEYHDVEQLRQYLLKELETFQKRSEKLGYDLDNILITRYCLSACLDEIISKTPWGIKANWKEKNLLSELQQDATADERFFVILDKVCHVPKKFIDTIELMYVCLNLGFEGKFRHQPFEKNRLQQIIDYTYEIIRKHRGEFNKTLSTNLEKSVTKKSKKRKTFLMGTILMAGLLTTIGLYFGTDFLLNNIASQTIQQIQQLTPR